MKVHVATTTTMSRTAQDAASQLPADRKPAEGIAHRPIWRHEAVVTNIPMGADKQPYRVVSTDGPRLAASGTFTLAGAPKTRKDAVVMLTSDHQAMVNTPANMHFAQATIEAELGPISTVIFAGDLVNIPDRASEWFDDQRGSAFFRAPGAGQPGRVGGGGPHDRAPAQCRGRAAAVHRRQPLLRVPGAPHRDRASSPAGTWT